MTQTTNTDEIKLRLTKIVGRILNDPSQAGDVGAGHKDSERQNPVGCEILLRQANASPIHIVAGRFDVSDSEVSLQKNTVFDIGELTKLFTTLITLRLVDQGLMSLEQRVSSILQSFGVAGKESICINHLLTGTSGYPDSNSMHRVVFKGEATLQGLPTRRSALLGLTGEIYRARLLHLPGKVVAESMISWLILGAVLETVSGTGLKKLFIEEVAKPLGLSSSSYIDLEMLRRNDIAPVKGIVAPTLSCPWRGRRLEGEVRDETAWLLSGIAPHAGMFGSANDLSKIISVFENGKIKAGGRPYLSDNLISKACGFEEGSIPMVWKKWSEGLLSQSSSIGVYGVWSNQGHGVWFDRDRKISLVYLSNSSQRRASVTFAQSLMSEILPVVFGG